MVIPAAILWGLAAWLVAGSRKAPSSRHRATEFTMAIVFVATANIAVLILAFHEHDRTAQLLSLATGATLVGALHLWTATLRAQRAQRAQPNKPHL